MSMRFCHSCCMPLDMPEAGKAHGNLCGYCSDDQGNLKPREVVQAGVAEWLEQVAPGASKAEYLRRADHYLKAMPAWQ